MSSSEQGTHFPAKIGHVLNDRPGVDDHSKFTIVRKLGTGSRSSVWLVRNTSSKEYYAAKIYTVEASAHAERVELPILKKVNSIGSKDELPTLRRNFWEGGENDSAKYFCALFDPTSTSVLDLLQQTEEGRLPLRAVQKIVRMVALGLKGLESARIMHGGQFWDL
jgi:serine/threonine protein kinase